VVALLAIVAFASRSGFGHASRSAPSNGYISYAFTAFMILFAAMIPIAAYSWLLQAREGTPSEKSFRSRIVRYLLVLGLIGVAIAVRFFLWHHLRFHGHASGLAKTVNAMAKARHGKSTAKYNPAFEWPVLWVALAVALVAGAVAYQQYRRRPKHVIPGPELTDADLLAATISEAIDDLEAEPDPRRAVIAAYARMEGMLGRRGLPRKPSETPLEFLRRALLRLTSRGRAVERLTGLFEQAKFSRHDIDAGMKGEAICALREIRDDVQGVPA